MSSELEADGGIYLIRWLAGKKAYKLNSRFQALENMIRGVFQVFFLIQVKDYSLKESLGGLLHYRL